MKSNQPVRIKMIIVTITTLLLASIAFSASAAVYTYDSLHRLTSVTYKNGQKIVYTYDPGGNMLTFDSHDADTPPTVKSTDPADGAIGVSVSANVYVTFSETVVEDIHFNEINIKNTADSSVVESTYSLNGDLLTIDPFNDLNYSVTYAVYIPAGAVKDTGGNSLANTYSFSFTTISAQDTVPPAVTSTDPSNGETGVAIDKIITITFSEAIQQGDYFNGIRLSLGGDTVSSATYVSGNSLTIDPDASLGYSSNYTVTIPAGSVKDGAGNALAEGYIFSFNTVEHPYIIRVTSPNGAENWPAGSTKQITWTYAGEGCPTDARISLYKGGVYQRTIINSVTPESGSYSWTIPGSTAAGDDYKVRITSNADVNVYDYSNANFTISRPITVTSPNGAESWPAGSTKQITWTYAGEGCPTDARISLYKGGVYQRTIINSVTPESGSYSWTIPGSTAAGDDYKVRITSNADVNVYDYSDANFTISRPITVTSPNGAESWQAGSTKQITWTYAGEGCPTDARISLYKGGVYQRTIINSVTPESGMYSWTIPGSTAAGDDYKVRITSNADVNVYDYSDANFTISSPITVTSPNGAESWQAGSTKQITWTYAGEGCPTDARISLYKGGVYQRTIINSVTPESGTYSWTIPGFTVAGDDYKVRITSNADVNVYDYSDANFTISSSP